MDIQQEVFHKVLVQVSVGLTEMELHGLRGNLKMDVVQDHMARQVIGHFRTWALGGNIQTVHFDRTVEWICPATWRDHLLQDIMAWADQRGYIRLGAFLEKRIKEVKFSRRVTDQQEVATHVCPHIAVAVTEGDRVHFQFLTTDPWEKVTS